MRVSNIPNLRSAAAGLTEEVTLMPQNPPAPAAARLRQKLRSERALVELKRKQPRVKFQLLSDLHFELNNTDYVHWPGTRRKPQGWPIKAKYIILAGDIGRIVSDKIHIIRLIEKLSKLYERIFYVAGNNEFKTFSRGSDAHGDGIRWLRTVQSMPQFNGRFIFMENDRYDLKAKNGKVLVSILGCTLWTQIREDQKDRIESRDLEGIGGDTIPKHNARYAKSLRFLKNEVTKIRNEPVGEERKILVITHMAPFLRGSSGVKTENARIPFSDNYSFYCNDILGGEGVDGLGAGDVWVWGHTHVTLDKVIDGVRTISNQRGNNKPPNTSGLTAGEFDKRRAFDM